jgi:simple sugar transport system permease protein
MIGINQAFAQYSGMKERLFNHRAFAGGRGVLSPARRQRRGAGGGIPTFLLKTARLRLDGNTVAILAKNNPLLVPLAAFLSLSRQGCQLMATYCDVPSEMIDISSGGNLPLLCRGQFLSGYPAEDCREKHASRPCKADESTPKG